MVVATDLFANPAFSAFWFLSKTDATIAMFFVPTVIGAALMLGEYFYFNQKD